MSDDEALAHVLLRRQMRRSVASARRTTVRKTKKEDPAKSMEQAISKLQTTDEIDQMLANLRQAQANKNNGT